MPLLLKSGGIFLHIPKTGGDWVTRVLTEQGLIHSTFGEKHADLDRVMFREGFEYARPKLRTVLKHWWRQKIAKKQLADEFLFCFVRHPLKWWESWFRYCKGLDWKQWGTAGGRHDWHPNAILNGTGHADFNQFLRNAIARRPGYASELFFTYTKPGIKFIGRQENLADDLISALRTLNENFDEDFIRTRPALNESRTPKEEVRWDPVLRQLVTQLELPGLVHFGYLTDADRKSVDIPANLPLPPSPLVSTRALPLKAVTRAA
jgi:hypothetical protein